MPLAPLSLTAASGSAPRGRLFEMHNKRNYGQAIIRDVRLKIPGVSEPIDRFVKQKRVRSFAYFNPPQIAETPGRRERRQTIEDFFLDVFLQLIKSEIARDVGAERSVKAGLAPTGLASALVLTL